MSPLIRLIHCSSMTNRLLMVVMLLTTSATVIAQPPVNHQYRIISTDAGVTDVLLALGMRQSLVGVDTTSVVPSQSESASSGVTPKVANLGYHRMLPAEGVLSLNPNMVIGSEHMGPPETIEAIKKADLVLRQLPVARDQNTLKANISSISRLVGKEFQAQALLKHIDDTMAQVNQQRLPASSQVAFLLQIDGRGLRLAGKSTTGDDIISLLGGVNIGQHKGYQSVSSEALLSLEPDVIIVAGRDDSQSSVSTLLKNNPLLQHTPAAQQRKIIDVDGRLLVAGVSLSAVDALADMANKLR